MKALLVGECRQGQLLDSSYELLGFAKALGASCSMFLVGSQDQAPAFDGTLYLADADRYGEFNPQVHRQLLLSVVEREDPDLVVFCHSSYGWDLAPRLSVAMKAAQVSEVVEIDDGALVVPACNAKLRRTVKPQSARTVVTIQAGAFAPAGPESAPQLVEVDVEVNAAGTEFVGYEAAEETGVDLGKAEVIVSAGRGIVPPAGSPFILTNCTPEDER